jgi:O-antigen/teichoic acid export membrane protein
MAAGQSRLRNYLTGLGTGYVRMFVQVLVGLWLVPFTLHYLDRERYAIFSLTLSVLGWLGLLDLGITGGLRIQAARLSGRPNPDELNRLASSAFFTQLLVVLAVLLVGAGIGIGFPHFFKVAPDLQHEAKYVFLIAAVGAGLSVGCQTFSALLIAHQQVHVDNLISLLMVVVRSVLTVLLLKMGWGLYSLAVAHVTARLVTSVLAVIRTYRVIPNLQIRYHLASWESLRGIANLGVWFTLGSLAGISIESLDSVVTAKVVSVATVTTFALTSRLYDFIGSLVFVVTETARPMLGQMLGQNRMADALKAYRHLFTMSTGLAMVASMAVWAVNCAFITRWIGAVNYGGSAVDLALALNLILHMWIMPNRAVLSANLVVKPQTLARLAEGALNLGLSLLLGKIWGLFGVLLATAISGLLTSMWVLPWLTARMFHRPFMQFIRDDAAPMLLLFTLLMPVALLGRYFAASLMGYGGTFVGFVFTGGVGAALLWWVIFDESLRARFPLRRLYEEKVLAPVRAWTGGL